MRLFTFGSIRVRLTFWFLVLALVPLFIGIMMSYKQEKQAIEQDALEKLISIRDLKVQQVEKWIDNRIGDVILMSEDFGIRSLEKIFDKKVKSVDDINRIETTRDFLSMVQRRHNDYEEIFFIDANSGIIKLSNNLNSEGNNKSSDLYFTVPLETGQVYIKDIHISQTLNRPQMTISSPIYCLEHGHHIIGILVARINLKNSLYALLKNRVGLGETGETLVVNKDAVSLSELRWFDNAPLKLKIESKPTVKAAQGGTGISKTKDYRDEDVMVAYTYLPKTGWGFVCKQDSYELNTPIRIMTKQFIFLFIVAALLIFIFVIFLIKSFSSPIMDMENAAKKIRDGDYSVRINNNSIDELSSLADSINEMTATIESRIRTQSSVTDISEVMIKHSTLHDFGSNILEQLMEITEANMSVFYVLNEGASEYEHFTSIGANKELLQSFSAKNPEGEFGNVLEKKRITYLKNIPQDTVFKYKTTAGDAVPKEIITMPVLVENRVVAIISLVKMQEFSKESYDTLSQSWVSINTSYSTLISNERTRILAEHLYKINKQLEAQSEELQDQTEELQQQSEELQEQTEELLQSSEDLQEQNIKLDAQKKHVEIANKLKSEFLSNMSHELRTPLNSIMALSRVLMTQVKDKLNEEENEYLAIVERNGKRLLALINDILDLSKIESGRIDILPEFVSISSILKTIIENMQVVSEEKGLHISLSVPDNLPLVETDASKLHQIVTNITANAVKFTDSGSVDVSVKYYKENLFIDVKDTGIGISKEMLPSIFDEFIQGDGSFSRKYEGTGLGLAIAHKLAQMLGGDINVQSELGKGSVFTIIIPQKWHQKRFDSKNDAYETTSWLSHENSKPLLADGRKLKVLVIEDNPDHMIVIKALLKESFSISEAVDVKGGLKKIQTQLPDFILLNMSRSEMSCEEALKVLKGESESQETKLIAVTAKAMKGDRDRFMKMGYDGYVSKPVVKEALFAEILRLSEL